VVLNDPKTTLVLRNCLEAAQHWLDIDGLSTNPDKTDAIVVGTNARQRTDDVIGTVDLYI